jgi:multisubunit Na+/H+ antiporter MnhE subunit
MHADMTITEIVAAVLATVSVLAIVWLALDGDAAAKTALTGLVGAASSYFLTPKLANGKPKPEPPSAAAS